MDDVGLIVDGLYVPPIGLHGIRNMRWGISARAKNTALNETVHYRKDTGMTTETTETNVPTDPAAAPKQKRVRNPFTKKENAPADAETQAPSHKKKPLYGVYAMGALLVVAGGVTAVASKLGKKDGDAEVIDISSDNPDVA